MANVSFKFGTKAQWEALAIKDPNTLYWLTDVQELRKGEFLYGKGLTATTTADGLLSKEDKALLDQLAGIHAIDNAVVIGSDANGKTIGLAISDATGNVLEVKSDGLFVPTPSEVLVPEYEIERQGEPEPGYSATYRLKKTVDGTSTYVGADINIPLDMVVSAAELKTVTVADQPYPGAKVGDKYIDLTIANAQQDHIYIPVNDLVDVYTAGDGIVINNNQISVTNRTVRELTGASGKALIFNELDGGGAKFEHADGTESFVGVNNGGKDGLVAQIYADRLIDGKWFGAKLDVTHGGMYYTVGDQSFANRAVEANEIATKGDIDAAALAWEEM